MELTQEQGVVAKAIIDYALENNQAPYIAVAGYAGTGKTTVMGVAAADILSRRPRMAISFCAPTAKAANVLRGKLEDFGTLNERSKVSTIHSNIYRLRKITKDYEMLWSKKCDEEIKSKLFIIDEASMINNKMFDDILSYGIPTIFIGDSGQLPPIEGRPFEPLVSTPYRLNTVHRQALDNPIVKIATDVRNGEQIPYGWVGNTFAHLHASNPEKRKHIDQFAGNMFTKDVIFLCSMHRTRIQINRFMRNLWGFNSISPIPCSGEHVICLRNDHASKIYNGQIFTSKSDTEEFSNDTCYVMDIYDGVTNKSRHVLAYKEALNSIPKNLLNNEEDDAEKINKAMEEFYCDEYTYSFKKRQIALFDYGYACTVHKAQGSEWDNVMLMNERMPSMTDDEYRKWLYTGITRARKNLCIITY